MSDESLIKCANCHHPKKNHVLPRSEGGAGGGDSGHCNVFSCGCRHFVPGDEVLVLEYIGDEMPSWVKEGVKVRVKSTSDTKKYGIAPWRGNDNIFGGEVGEVHREDSVETWRWVAIFSRYRKLGLDAESLENLKKAR